MKSDKNNAKGFITLFVIIIILIIAGLYYGSFDRPTKHLFNHKLEQAEAVIPPDQQLPGNRN